jgi:hypothetical protein
MKRSYLEKVSGQKVRAKMPVWLKGYGAGLFNLLTVTFRLYTKLAS